MPLSFQDGEPDQREQRPEAVKTGQVWKVAGVKLEVGKGPEESTTVLSTDGQVTLPPRAVLVLLPESVAVLRSIAGGVAGDVEASTPVVRTSVPLPPEIGACVEPACTVVHATNVEMAEPARLQTISLQHLGYRRLTTAEMRTLEYGAAVAFLGSDHLLFTYNPHTLVTREKGDRVEDRPHMVHAVLFDLRTGLAERTINWRVRNEAQYLWIVNGNEVLVHDGDRLRWLGSGLREEHALPLEGPLAFVRISPDRRHYVVGVAHELHSEAEHAELAKADVRGPEERIVIHMLDEELRSLDEGSMSSRAIPPLALDGGRLELRHGQGGHYYLRETVWNGTAHRDFARMSSACVPTVDTLSANLLAVEGCNDASLDHWYRVFREDGSPVLKSMVHWREFSPLIADDGKRDVFALAIPEARREYVQERAFRGADLEHELVRVHRASDGRELAQMRMRFPLPARQPVAFSPDGERVAVIDGEEIVLYDTGGAVRSH